MFVYYRYVCIFVEIKPPDMIITKEHLDAMVEAYLKKTGDYKLSTGYIHGLRDMIDLVDKKLKSKNQQS